MSFVKASKKQAKARFALQGPAGSGKTFTALSIATHLVEEGQPICLVDTEYKSAEKYADLFSFQVDQVMGNYHPEKVTKAIAEAHAMGAGVLIFDSLTAFWNNSGGFLELVDEEVKKQKARNQKPDSFAAWKVVDPIYRRMVQALLAAPMHIFTGLRAKTAYERTQDERGNTKIQKMGLAPEIRDSFQYEMDIEGMLDMDHNLVIGKTRCHALDGKVFTKPGKDVAEILRAWLTDGEAPEIPKPDLKGAPPNPATDPTPDTVRRLVAEVGGDLAKFTAAYKTDSVDSMTPDQLAHAVALLERKKAKAVADAAKTDGEEQTGLPGVAP